MDAARRTLDVIAQQWDHALGQAKTAVALE